MTELQSADCRARTSYDPVQHHMMIDNARTRTYMLTYILSRPDRISNHSSEVCIIHRAALPAVHAAAYVFSRTCRLLTPAATGCGLPGHATPMQRF